MTASSGFASGASDSGCRSGGAGRDPVIPSAMPPRNPRRKKSRSLAQAVADAKAGLHAAVVHLGRTFEGGIIVRPSSKTAIMWL